MKTNQPVPKLPFEQHEKTCELCGKHFYSKRRHTRFCSDSHRAFASRQRRDLKKLATGGTIGRQAELKPQAMNTMEAHVFEQRIQPVVLQRENGLLFAKCPKCSYRVELTFADGKIPQKTERDLSDHVHFEHKDDGYQVVEAFYEIQKEAKRIFLGS